MDLAYESGALRGDISRIQYWALAYYLVSHRRDADERAELERKWHAFFADRKLYEQVFLKDQEDEEEQSAEFGDGDLHRPGIRQPDVLGGKAKHAAGDIQGILPAFPAALRAPPGDPF